MSPQLKDQEWGKYHMARQCARLFAETEKFLIDFPSYLLQPMTNSSVIKQKGESQNGGNKKTKHAKFSEKQTLLTPLPSP